MRRKHLVAILILGLLPAMTAGAFDITVVDADGVPITGGFRWLIEEDNSNDPRPGELVPGGLDGTVTVNLDVSYAPALLSGHSDTASTTIDLPPHMPADGRYFVSVLPDSGYTMSGTTVHNGQPAATVRVNAHQIPTAQFSVFAFHDNAIINNAPDIPNEIGLEGFTVQVSDMAGQMMLDAFGNMLGTTYMTDAFGNPMLDPEGNPIVHMMGSGIILTDANGEALVKYLPQGKFGVRVIPPGGQGWIQTATIEGTPVVDAWVKPGEPSTFIEFGPGDWHVFIGFVQPMDLLSTLPNPSGSTATITGQCVNNHLSSPPGMFGYPGAPVPDAYVGLNEMGSLQAVYVAPCAEDGSFVITGVPPGAYQIVWWDRALDYLFSFQALNVPAEGGTIELGALQTNAWFSSLEGSVFHDMDQDGFRDPMEMGVPGQAVITRFRDGTIHKGTATDGMGNYSLPEVFPFFKFLVMEVDFARYKATGATFVVDDGGPVPPHDGWNMPSWDKLNPQPQPEVNPNTGNVYSRTETGEVLTQAAWTMVGSVHHVDFGKAPYAEGENGGISGVVFYAFTRAEDDPRYAGGEPWESGIPRVQMNLYDDYDLDGMIDDLNLDGMVTLADVDNHPQGDFPGPGDVDRNGNGNFDPGDALNIGYTDSWDDSPPEGCVNDPIMIHGQPTRDCWDGLGSWNQLRPAVFDGGYAFTSHFPDGMESGSEEVEGLPCGMYVVECSVPPNMTIQREQDKNVDFGDEYIPSTNALPPICVGDDNLVPPELLLFPGVEAPYAGETRPLCDRKQVRLNQGYNAAADFFCFTEVPKAARVDGIITNDLGPEWDPNSPVYGEKGGPSWIPISFRDFAGNEIVRTYCDEWGGYDALVPGNFTNNIGAPAGMTPNMLTIVLNHPGPVPDPNNPGQFITDPWFEPSVTTIGYTLNFNSGTYTFCDTPVLPVGAFTSQPYATLDCALPNGTPIIRQASANIGQGGPLVTAAGQTITLLSPGFVDVPNPDYSSADPVGQPRIRRDYSFGPTTGTVTVDGVALTNLVWATDGLSITATVPAGARTGELVVTRGDNQMPSIVGVTLHIGTAGRAVHHVTPGMSIQTAINNAGDGDLILIAPGFYHENIIMWKPVRLQGWGAYSTFVNGGTIMDPPVTAAWTSFVQSLVDFGDVDLVPGQKLVDPFIGMPGPTVLVLAKEGAFTEGRAPLIDGLTLYGSPTGGGVLVNGYAHYLRIANNRIMNNSGFIGGGIIVGMPSLLAAECEPYFCSSMNDHIRIDHNHITVNSGFDSGGGIALHNGADDYIVEDNYVCGNLSAANGAGVAHYGLSDPGRIQRNAILFNEASVTLAQGHGAGVLVSGEPGAPGGLGAGSGSVVIDANLIQGNLAGDGLGGGIFLRWVNGADVEASANPPHDWYSVGVFNNMIVNNAAAYAAGGLAIHEAARVAVINNTITHNDSLATSLNAFGAGGLALTVPQPAGLVTLPHGVALNTAIGTGPGPEFSDYSNPVLHDNIIWFNHSYRWNQALNAGLGALEPNPDREIWDLHVLGGLPGQMLFPEYCILTDTAGTSPTNLSADPLFFTKYLNDYTTAAAADEGGTFVFVSVKPLKPDAGNYHIRPGSPAAQLGGGMFFVQHPELAYDIDGEARALGAIDSGADQITDAVPPALPDHIGIYRLGTWYLDVNGNGSWDGTAIDRQFSFGGTFDNPIAGDWTGDGRTEVGVRRLNGEFRLDWNGNGRWDGQFTDRSYNFRNLPAFDGGKAEFDEELLTRADSALLDLPFEATGDEILAAFESAGFDEAELADLANLADRAERPVTGDWNGDGDTEIGLWRDGTWFLDSNGNGRWDGTPTDTRYNGFGTASDRPVTGDWNGDGVTEIGYVRGNNWYLDMNGNGVWDGGDLMTAYGPSNYAPIPGNWDGFLGAEIGRYGQGRWQLDANANGAWDGCQVDRCYSFGTFIDQPVAGKW